MWGAIVFFVEELMVAMARAKEHLNKHSRTRERTPQRRKMKDVPVIGSSCTWKRDELDHFKVTIERDIDVRTMIPDEVFEFDHFEGYSVCPNSQLMWNRLMVGKSQLCTLGERDVEN
jgi:hypothetical protein